jgi:hypothetical protein
MIEKTSSYKTSDGAVFATIDAAQTAEIVLLIGSGKPPINVDDMAEWCVSNLDALLAILGTKARKKRVSKAAKAVAVKTAAKTTN